MLVGVHFSVTRCTLGCVCVSSVCTCAYLCLPARKFAGVCVCACMHGNCFLCFLWVSFLLFLQDWFCEKWEWPVVLLFFLKMSPWLRPTSREIKMLCSRSRKPRGPPSSCSRLWGLGVWWPGVGEHIGHCHGFLTLLQLISSFYAFHTLRVCGVTFAHNRCSTNLVWRVGSSEMAFPWAGPSELFSGGEKYIFCLPWRRGEPVIFNFSRLAGYSVSDLGSRVLLSKSRPFRTLIKLLATPRSNVGRCPALQRTSLFWVLGNWANLPSSFTSVAP